MSVIRVDLCLFVFIRGCRARPRTHAAFCIYETGANLNISLTARKYPETGKWVTDPGPDLIEL